MVEVLKTHPASCQRRTCLEWEVNRERSALDREYLMRLLCDVDRQASESTMGAAVSSGQC